MERSRESTLVALGEAGRQIHLESHVAWLPGSIWPEINTGVSVARSGLYYHPAQIRSGEADARAIEPSELRYESFWETAGTAGRRVAVIDPVQCVPVDGLNGLQIVEWGTHDRHFITESSPAALLPDLEQRHGAYPVDSCNRINQGGRGCDRLRELLIEGLARKVALSLDLLAREHWDLFCVTFSEAHCAGHHLWPLPGTDGSGARAAPDSAFAGLDAVVSRLDRAVGRLLEAAEAEAALIVASHGMDTALRVEHLLPECLDRLGLGFARRGRVRAASLVPAFVRRIIRRVVGTSTIERWQLGVESRVGHFTGSSAAVALHNGATGAIRLSIAGREPGGLLQPGPQVDDTIDLLRKELVALRDGRTGEPVVDDVCTTDSVLGTERHADLPDVLVRFRQASTSTESVVSPHGWTATQPRSGGRTGEHVADSRVWLAGEPLATRESANVLDVAPTILRLLGVESGARHEGSPFVG